MAVLPYDILFDDRPEENGRDLDENYGGGDDSGPIGPVDAQKITLLTTTKFVNDELVFSDEVPAVLADEYRELVSENNCRYQWIRKELKAMSRPQVLTSGYTLITANWPRHNGWVHHTKFKPAYKEAKNYKPIPNCNNVSDAWEWLENQPFDYWETRSGILTAGISRPTRWLESNARTAGKKGFTLLGLTEDFDKAINYLMNSQKVLELRKLTSNGTIAVGGHADLNKSTTKKIKLYDELIVDKALWELYLYLATLQALAGVKDDESEPANDWKGKPVVNLINKIYCEHLNNLNRRIRNRNLKVPISDIDPESLPDLDNVDDTNDDNGYIGQIDKSWYDE